MRTLKLVTFLFVTLLTSTILLGCKKEELVKSQEEYYQYFDTRIVISIWDNKKVSDKQWNEIEEIIKHIQYTFKRTAPKSNEEESELYKLNHNYVVDEPYKVSDDLFEVIKIGLEYAEATNGKLNPAIGPLVDLWDITGNQARIGKGEDPIVPTDEQIQNILLKTNYNDIILNEENKTVTLKTDGMIIDLGSIAKGFAADKLADYLKSEGFKHAILNLGGNIFAFGNRYEKKSDGTDTWGVGVQDPQSPIPNDYMAIIYVVDKTVVSSGTYERYFLDPVTNEPYHHILDSDTGYPVENNLSGVTIITTSSTLADALSTSVFAMGLEDGMEFIEGMDDAEAIFIEKNNTVHKTSGVDSKYNYTPY